MNNLSALSTAKRTSKLAITSLTLGVVSTFIQLFYLVEGIIPYYSHYDYSYWLHNSQVSNALEFAGWVIITFCGVLALILGSIALVKIRHTQNLKGRRIAIGGIICGCEFMFLLILVLLKTIFFPVPIL